MFLDKFISYISTIEEEDFESVPADKLGHLLARLARSETYKQKEREKHEEKIDAAMQKLMSRLSKALPDRPELLAELKEYAHEVFRGEGMKDE